MKLKKSRQNPTRLSRFSWRMVQWLALTFSLSLFSEVGAQENEVHDKADNPGMFYGPKIVLPREFWPAPFQPKRKLYGGNYLAEAEILYPNQRQSFMLNNNSRVTTSGWVEVTGGAVVMDTPEEAQAYVEQWASNPTTSWKIESRNNISGADAAVILRTFDTDGDTDFLASFCLGRAWFRIDIDGNTVHFDGADRYKSAPPPDDAQLLGYINPWADACFKLARQNSWHLPVERNRSSNLTPVPTDGVPGSLDAATLDSGYPTGSSTLAVTGFTSLALAGLSALGAGLMMFGMGVTPREVVEGVRELFNGSSPPSVATESPPVVDDDFERWKRDYESRGWRYAEKDGVAEFEPVEGATNESGWTYSEERGDFEPPEDERPEPEIPPADASYKEEVRLLQEDLERQSDLLDRERERLRQYEQAGLKELLPGANERIREYEKLADLNRTELDRLNENLPTRTIEDNRDLEADAGERLRSRDLIHDISEGDQRIEAGEAQLENTQAEIDQIEEEIDSLENELILTPELTALDDKFRESGKELFEEGFRVLNPGYDAPLVPGKLIDGTAMIGYQFIEKTGLSELIIPGCKAVRCGGFAEIGDQKIKGFIKDLYGDRADEVIVDKVFVDVVRGDSLGGKVNQVLDTVTPKNHVANRVILPDGRRYILDYWEGSRAGRTSMVPEEQWLERWKGRMGDDFKYIGSDDGIIHSEQNKLMTQVDTIRKRKGKSLEEALAVYRQQQEKTIKAGIGSPEVKERHLKQIETLIKSYRRHGRFNSEGLENYVQ